MSRLTSALISKGATNATTYDRKARLNPGRVSGQLRGAASLSSPGQLQAPRIQPGLISAARMPNAPMVDQSPVQDALNRGGQAFMLAVYKGAMDMADRRTDLESNQGMLDLRAKYRDLMYSDKGLTKLSAQKGSTVYKDNEQRFVEMRDQIAMNMDPAARRKFVVKSEPFVNGQLNELAKLEMNNLNRWEVEQKAMAEIGDNEIMAQKAGDVGEVARIITNGRERYGENFVEAIKYQDRMWQNWANLMMTQPGDELSKIARFDMAKQIPPEAGGMTGPMQTAIEANFRTMRKAANVTAAYQMLMAEHKTPEAALRAMGDPDTIKSMDIDTAKSLHKFLEDQVQINTKIAKEQRAQYELQVTNKLNTLINEGNHLGAQTFVNGLDNSFDKIALSDKIAKSQDRTDPTVYQQAAELARNEQWSKLAQYVADKRLVGLNNSHADRFEKMVADAKGTDTGGSKQSAKKMVMTMAKDTIEGPLLPGFEMMLDDYIANNQLSESDPAIIDIGEKLLKPYRESRIPFNTTYVPIEDQMKFMRRLAKEGGPGSIGRQEYLADEVKTLYELIEEGQAEFPEPVGEGTVNPISPMRFFE